MSENLIYYVSHRLKMISFSLLGSGVAGLLYFWLFYHGIDAFSKRSVDVFGKSISASDCVVVIGFFVILLAVFAVDGWATRWKKEKEEFYKYADKIKECLDSVRKAREEDKGWWNLEAQLRTVELDLAAMFDIFSPPHTGAFSSDEKHVEKFFNDWENHLVLTYARAKRRKLWKARRESRRFAPSGTIFFKGDTQ